MPGSDPMRWFGVMSYGLAAVTYGVITAIQLANHPGGRNAVWITIASGVSMLWAAGMAAALTVAPSLAVVAGLDGFHVFVWTACVLSWLMPSSQHPKVYGRALMLGLSAFLWVWSVVAAGEYPQSVFLAQLGMGLVGLLAVEQVFRNARDEQRRHMQLLSLGIGGIFVINLFVYSQASLLGGLVSVFLQGRGLGVAALAPLLVIGIKRQLEWEQELFVSRQVAFYTASLVAAGSYLLAMGAAAYLIRAAGGHWGPPLELSFLVVAVALLVFVLFSANIRARAKVFLIKHFYRNKYDYRLEWLRLTAVLSRGREPRRLAASALEGIAGIVGSREGTLWLAVGDGSYQQAASLDGEQNLESYDKTHPIVEFLDEQGWVIDSQEYASYPDRYGTAFGDPADGLLPQDSIIVPLDCQGYLQGFVILGKPPEVEALNFEDHDILKTAGRQVAVVLAQAIAQEQLTATRQFEAVNKLATFLMHDLKNVIAQQELVVTNAQRFRHRPEFIDDAITTLSSSVERMRKVLDQLRSATHPEPSRTRVDVSKVLMEVRSHCADRHPVPEIGPLRGPLWVEMDREKLASVLTHVIRNAQDATPPTGSITVSVERLGDELSITVTDTGAGMDRAFVRDRLFRPFDSTKGAKGMGIGAYQAREIVRGAGGDVEVRSEPGRGTAFRVKLPLATGDGVMLNQPAA